VARAEGERVKHHAGLSFGAVHKAARKGVRKFVITGAILALLCIQTDDVGVKNRMVADAFLAHIVRAFSPVIVTFLVVRLIGMGAFLVLTDILRTRIAVRCAGDTIFQGGVFAFAGFQFAFSIILVTLRRLVALLRLTFAGAFCVANISRRTFIAIITIAADINDVVTRACFSVFFSVDVTFGFFDALRKRDALAIFVVGAGNLAYTTGRT
jgi:hypothetical protein